MSEPTLILSASSIAFYLRCHYRYLLSNVYRIGGGRPSMAAVLGAAVHAGVEAFWKSPTRPDAALRRSFERELATVPTPFEEEPSVVLAAAERMLGTYIGQVAPTFKPTMVEQSFLITVEGVGVSGTLDAADENDVRDLKTVSMISKFYPTEHRLQLSLYRLGYKALTGHYPRKLLLDVLPRRGKIVYRSYEIEPDMAEVIDVIGIVSEGIAAEDYEPTGATGGACHYCPYRLVCKHSTEKG